MSLTRYLWDAVNNLAEIVGVLEDHKIPENDNTDSSPTSMLPSPDLQLTSEQDHSTDREHTGPAAWLDPQLSNAKQDPLTKAVNGEEVTIYDDSDLESNESTDFKGQNDELQQGSSNVLIEKDPLLVNTHRIDQDLSGQNKTLQEDNVRHLKWQDRASMTIRTMKEEAGTRKHEARAAKKAAVRARAALQRQVDDFKRQVERSEQDRVRMTNENARVIEAHQSSLQQMKDELEGQKEAADSRSTEVQTKHDEDMSVANAKIQELRAAHGFTFISPREANELREQLSQTKKEKTEELAAKDEEIRIQQNCIEYRDLRIHRLMAEAEDDREARRKAIREKDRLDRAKLAADRDAKKLKEENVSLESRALTAEGCAKGYLDQLRATKTRAEIWETMYKKTEENARNEALSAYDLAPTPFCEEEQQTTTTTTINKEGESRKLVEGLQKENSELQGNVSCLTAEIAEWRRVWSKAFEECEAWQEDRRRWEENFRRECDEEKKKALAVEREKCRVQWESQESSLRGQSTLKFKSHANQELRKLRRKTGSERNMQMKVKKSQLKRAFKQAVSHAVDVERSLLQTQFQTQFQTELSDYKTRIESEHAKSQTQSETQNNTGSSDQVLLNAEIKKRDDFIEKQKEYLTKAFEAKRESESAKQATESAKRGLEKQLQNVREENQRLSRDVIAYDSQKALVSQTKSEAQITLMAKELVRALKLFTEISILGLDEKHRRLLNELILANKVVRDIRTTIEEGALVDYQDFQNRVDQVFASSDGFDDLHPQERPAMHAQLLETYSIIGSLNNILASERGDTTNQEILELIYRDIVKGKGKQGAMFG